MPSELVTTVLPLVGVALGAAGSFAAQYLVTRETKKQASRAAQAALRAERKEAILAFLDVCQRVERAAEHRFQNDNAFVEGSPELTHEMRFRQKCLDLVAGRHLGGTALDFTDCLTAAAYGRVPAGKDVWTFIKEGRTPFMEAAKAELGIVAD
ncbi:hypothetical protein [Streptomyces sp. NRRL B-24484]|uniref:hypothetical protein n=1 Tax=Streptomyces sp. NRRL B-24484 TaxID=1463833 RepID=UPI00069381FB|nr:hypothetical protein [Streptomyces sp. NRRL B-24484]